VAGRLADWPLEYPPTAAALVARLEAGIPARTVVWLGELCRYADADGGAAALSGLAELLDGEGHLIITTLWPEHWEAYMTAAGARRGASDLARRRTRQDQLVPASLWGALIAGSAAGSAGDLARVAQAARDRGLQRGVARLLTAPRTTWRRPPGARSPPRIPLLLPASQPIARSPAGATQPARPPRRPLVPGAATRPENRCAAARNLAQTLKRRRHT